VDTLLVSASVLIEQGDVAEARQLFGDASALLTVSSSVYDRIHRLIVAALLERAENNPKAAAASAAEARKMAEGQALVSYHVYGTAIEAAARVDLGDTQAGVLLATTALGAVEGMEGSEYGIEVRSLCCQAVIRAIASESTGRSGSTMTADVCRRALNQVDRIAGYIREPRMRELFFQRPPVRAIVELATRVGSSRGSVWDALSAPGAGASADGEELSPGSSRDREEL
jgi:hypothetical protein